MVGGRQGGECPLCLQRPAGGQASAETSQVPSMGTSPVSHTRTPAPPPTPPPRWPPGFHPPPSSRRKPTWALPPQTLPGLPATTGTMGSVTGQVVGSDLQTLGCRETEATRPGASVDLQRPGFQVRCVKRGPLAGSWEVAPEPSLQGELAACISLPTVPSGDCQLCWLIPSLFPTVPEVFIVLCHAGFGSHSENLGVYRHRWHLWTPAPP